MLSTAGTAVINSLWFINFVVTPLIVVTYLKYTPAGDPVFPLRYDSFNPCFNSCKHADMFFLANLVVLPDHVSELPAMLKKEGLSCQESVLRIRTSDCLPPLYATMVAPRLRWIFGTVRTQQQHQRVWECSLTCNSCNIFY